MHSCTYTQAELRVRNALPFSGEGRRQPSGAPGFVGLRQASRERVHLRFAELKSPMPADARFRELKVRCSQ
jgi:hypothetical protein